MDENVKLVRGWAKETDQNHLTLKQLMDDEIDPIPLLSLVSVSKIKHSIIGIPDDSNETPYSYIFLPPRAMWPDIFVEMMKSNRKRSLFDNFDKLINKNLCISSNM